MNIINHIREVNGVKEVNSVGYFKSDFFNLDKLLERQKLIYDFYEKLENGETKDQMENLYNITEKMRVILITKNG